MSSEGRENESSRLRWGYLAFLLLVFVTLMVAIVRGAATEEPEKQAERPLPLREVSPEVVAQSYLSSLKLRHLDSAYLLLSAELRARASEDGFERSVSLWLDEGENAWELKYRVVGECTLEGNTARLFVLAETGAAEQTEWEWHLLRTTDGWRLSDFQKGPKFGFDGAKT